MQKAPIEKPIIFSGPMVRAILDGNKTQTRRLRGLNIVNQNPDEWEFIGFTPDDSGDAIFRRKNKLKDIICKNYYGVPGDYLWVKENWKYWDWTEDGDPCIKYQADGRMKWFWEDLPYKYWQTLQDTWEKLSHPKNYEIDNCARDHRWRSSILMPQWASRINLLNKRIRVERLQDITEEDAKAEGVQRDSEPGQQGDIWYEGIESYRECFMCYWDKLNKERGYDSDHNPWVRVIEFERNE